MNFIAKIALRLGKGEATQRKIHTRNYEQKTKKKKNRNVKTRTFVSFYYANKDDCSFAFTLVQFM